MKIFRLIPKFPLALPALAVILLMAVAACGGGAQSTAETAAQQEAASTPNETSAQQETASTPDETSAQQETALTPAETPAQQEAVSTLDETPSATQSLDEATAPETTPAPTTVPASEQQIGGEVGNLAPEFQRVSNWINSPPLTMEGLRGQVVLIDFWTYTCVNCIRTFPYLKEWHAKYADRGLTIVGVHTPEFDFEKVTENVVRSAGEYGLGWPIAQDNDFGTWRAYSNRFWPAKYLVDRNGTVRYTHFGEGAYIETEEQIRMLLEEAGSDLTDVEISIDDGPKADVRAFGSDQSTRLTREIYGGFQRNASPRGVYVAHPEYYDGPNQTLSYVDPGDHQNQFMYLQGLWTNGFEDLRHAQETQNYEDYIALKFAATSVNAVVHQEGDDPFDVQVTIDGRPLSAEEAGADLVIADGRSFFTVTNGRLYEVVALPEFGIHELSLSSNSPDFSLFAFTFGAYDQGP